jgi:hypothetical protein
MELLVDMVHVGPHCFQADTESGGDFLQDEALHELIEDLHFPRRELLRLDLRFLTAVEELHAWRARCADIGAPPEAVPNTASLLRRCERVGTAIIVVFRFRIPISFLPDGRHNTG